MSLLNFNFSEDSLSRLFPFYILLDKDVTIKSFGKSVPKICSAIQKSSPFLDFFQLENFSVDYLNSFWLTNTNKEEIIVKVKNNELLLKGNFEFIDNSFLFIGFPCLNSVQQENPLKLNSNDFGLWGSHLDFSNQPKILENKEANTEELLTIIRDQQHKIEEVNKQNQEIALFPMQNPDCIFRIDSNGKLLKRNPAAKNLSSFVYNGVCYAAEDFFKFIVTQMDLDKERWEFETKANEKDFYFSCVILKELGCINIYGRDITEQKKAEEELNRLSLVAKVNNTGVVFVRPNGKIFWCNEAFLKLLRFSKEEVIDRTPLEVGHFEFTDIEEIAKMTKPFYRSEPFDVELTHKRRDGSNFWTRIKGQPVFDSNGKVSQYFALVEDVSKEIISKNALKESENRLATLILNLETAILLEDENRKILLANKKFCDSFGINVEPEELKGTDASTLTEESKDFFISSNEFVDRIKTIVDQREAVYNEALELKDGRVFHRSFIPIYKEGIYSGHLWSLDDITIKKRYDENLQIEKEKYRSIIANMNLGLLEVDKDDVITLANHSFCEMCGYSIDELIGKKASELLTSQESAQLLATKSRSRRNGTADIYEVKVIDKRGKTRNWLISGAPNYNSNGKIIGSIGIHLDITDQKDQEEQLYLLSLIAEKNINPVIIADAQGRIEWANTSFLTMSGYSLQEIMKQKPGHFLQGEETNPETVKYIKDRISKGLPFNCEIVNYAKNGKKYWVSIRGQALYNKKGKILKFFAIEEDVTKKKELEEQREFLVQSLDKRNKELEDYASIVSHDLKSPLRSIHSLVTWIQEDNDKELSEQTIQYLSMIEGKVEKMDYLIEGVLMYAKIDKVDQIAEKVNTTEIIQNIINIIYIPSHISVTITGDLPVITADRFRVQQLFQNLISNAVNYIDKPIGLVEVSCLEESENYIFLVKDNGPGIAKENQTKIFEIFQSLESSDKSTGLGLSIVKKIIDIYEGEIWIESELGIGTTFFIKLHKQ